MRSVTSLKYELYYVTCIYVIQTKLQIKCGPYICHVKMFGMYVIQSTLLQVVWSGNKNNVL